MSNINKFIKSLKGNWQSYLIIVLLLVLVGGSAMSSFFRISSSSIMGESYSYDSMASSKIANGLSSYYGGSDSALYITERKVIKNANINLETDKYVYSKNSITSLVETYSGIVLTDSESRDRNDNRHTNMAVKINSKDIDAFLEEVKKLGEVTSLNVYSNDITGSYVDYTDRLNRYEEQIKKYNTMLESEKITIEEEVQVQSRIDQLEEQIYYLKERLGDLDEDISYSEVYISLSEKPSLLEEVNFLGFKEVGVQFLGSLKNGLSILLNIFGFVIPFVIVYFVYRLGRRFVK